MNLLKSSEFFTDRMVQAANAVQLNDISTLNLLVDEGLNINALGKHNMTLLIWALSHQKKHAAHRLLELGADPNLELEDGDSAVTLAAGANDIEMLRMLLEHGGNPDALNQHGQPALFEAASRSLWKHFELLISHGASITATDKRGQTVLLRLASVNRFDDVERLLSRGFDIHQAERSGATLAWYVDSSAASSKTAAGQARDRLKEKLRQQGVRFPVPLPKRS